MGIRSWITPTIEEKLSYQARVLVTAAVNQAVAEELERMGVTYHQMVRLTRDGTGKVTALQADTVLLNQIKSAVTEQVGERLQDLSSHDLSIPLGSLTGLKIFSGRGSSISFRLMPEGVVMTNLYHEFSQAGVNQTLHRICCRSTWKFRRYCRAFPCRQKYRPTWSWDKPLSWEKYRNFSEILELAEERPMLDNLEETDIIKIITFVGEFLHYVMKS